MGITVRVNLALAISKRRLNVTNKSSDVSKTCITFINLISIFEGSFLMKAVLPSYPRRAQSD